jgi:predicted nucleic acid-binding protein
VAERWVVNASPLIALGKIGRLDLLVALADELVVPEAVAAEVRRFTDEAGAVLGDPAYRIANVDPDPIVMQWGLGEGETAVLSLAKRSGSHTAVVDDLAARRCASAVGIATRGTLGVILLARSRGIIPSVEGVLRQLHGAGLYLSPRLLADVLALAGESSRQG